MNSPNFKVDVRCMTFNQSKYITDTLDGFCMQQTTFPFLCLIVDDASTDGEQVIIKQYLKDNFDLSEISESYEKETDYGFITYARNKNNRNCYFLVLLLKENHYSNPAKFAGKKLEYLKKWREGCKYEALCEGDDYWINPLKLEKQYQALEANAQATMVYCDYRTVDMDGNNIIRPQYEKLKRYHRSGNNLVKLFEKNYPLTCTIMIRMEVYKTSLYKHSPSRIDYALFMCAAFGGDFIYIDEVVSSYRMNPNSLMNSNIKKVSREFRKSNIYFSKEYLLGHCKKNGFISNILIRYKISQNYLFAKGEYRNVFRELCSIDRLFFCYIPIVLLANIIKKLRIK